jgi:HK97 family phage portal protein
MGLASSLFAVAFGGSQSSSSDGWISQGLFTGGEPTFAGVAVDEQKALTFSAVFRSVVLISDAVSMLPIEVRQRVGDRRVERPNHPVAKLLENPNELMAPINLFGAVQGHTLQYGNGYLDIQRTQGGEPIKLWPLLPDRTRPAAVVSDGERRIAYRTVVDGQVITAEPANVAHIRGLSFDGIRGYSPLWLARQSVGLALGLEEFGAKFFGNDAKSGGFLEHPGKLGDAARKNLTDSMDAQGGIENAHRVKILEEGMKFNPTTVSPEDSQFLLTRTFQVEDIARFYGIPLHMLQSQAKTTSWGTGIAQMSLGFVIYTLLPWLIRWEQELARKLFTEQEIEEGFFLRFVVNALLRAAAIDRAKFYTAALNTSTGWMDRQEVRDLEDLNPDEIENTAPQTMGMVPPPDDDDEPEEPIDEDEDEDDG